MTHNEQGASGTTSTSPGAARRPRALALGAIATAVALALAGCGGDGGSADAGGAPKEVTVWHYFSDPNQVKVMTDFEAKFEKSHPDAQVTNVYVPYDQLNSKLSAAAGSKSGPDVVVFNGADTSTLALAGALAPLDEQWAGYADKDQFPESVIHKTNDSIYSVQGYVNLLGLWYNADLLAQIDVQPPTNIDELETALQTVKDADKKGITLSGLPQSQGEWQAYPWLAAHGFDYETPDEGAMASALAMVRGWVEKGYLTQEAVTWDQTVPFQQFLSGDVAFAENGNWQMGTAASDAKFKYGVVPLPLGEDGKVYLGGEGEAIGAFSKNPKLAWEYLQETYFDAEGQLIPVNNVGSLPSRLDTAQNEAVTGNELLKPFAETIAKYGANYPADVIPAEGIADVQLAVGKAWSAALSGQQTPQEAASTAVTIVKKIIE